MWLSLYFLTGVQPVPYPFLLPCCLPKPIPPPRALHGHFPFISGPVRPGVNPKELRDSGLPPLASALHVSANGWPHKSPMGWDLNHISRSLFGGAKHAGIQGEERRAGSDALMKGKEWSRGTKLQQMDCFPPLKSLTSNLLAPHCKVVYYSLPVIHVFCIYWVGPWCVCVFFFFLI